MNIKRGNPPATVEREAHVEFTRDEVLSFLATGFKAKYGMNYRFDDMKVAADEKDKLQSVTISGVELVSVLWKDSPNPNLPTPPVTAAGTK